jgi:hypothetical protein
MPNQKIAITPVDNGDEKHDNVLRIQWGEFGGAPDAPKGWVNQGYAMVVIDHVPGSEAESTHYVMLEPAELDHMIRTLKRIRRKTFDRAAVRA